MEIFSPGQSSRNYIADLHKGIYLTIPMTRNMVTSVMKYLQEPQHLEPGNARLQISTVFPDQCIRCGDTSHNTNSCHKSFPHPCGVCEGKGHNQGVCLSKHKLCTYCGRRNQCNRQHPKQPKSPKRGWNCNFYQEKHCSLRLGRG